VLSFPVTERLRIAIPPATYVPATLQLRLFIAGNAPNSALARRNLNAICQAHFRGRFEIEVVDVLEEPLRALADLIRLTPTVLRLMPGYPDNRIVGTLDEPRRVMLALGLAGQIQ
jgi:circadian clock protein KaiB